MSEPGKEMGPLLEVGKLSVSRGGKPILREVSFEVAAGEWVAVVGENGAGKSTLLKSLVRVLPRGAATGTARLLGRDLRTFAQKELARLLAYVPQLEEGEDPFTVEESVLLGRYPHLSPFTSVGPADRSAVAEALDLTGMAPFAARRMDTLSGGERQKAAIAGALAQGAPFLLLDEPTAFLDPRHAGEVLALLARLNRERRTAVLSVTHDLNAAASHARRVLALKKGGPGGPPGGEVAWFGPANAFLDNAVLHPVFGKEFQFATHPGTGRRVALP